MIDLGLVLARFSALLRQAFETKWAFTTENIFS